MLHYIIQTIGFQLVFLIVYDLFLRKETFFNYNRAYLLSTAVLSFILPFIKVEKFKTIVPEEFVIKLPEVIIGNVNSPTELTLNDTPATLAVDNAFKWSWEFVLAIGIGLAAFVFIVKLVKLIWLISKNPKHWKGDILIVKLINSSAAFSFFHYVFLGEKLKPEEAVTILDHERIHVEEKHTIDLLLFEVLRVAFWFNPLIYMYQNRIRTLHEYIADAKAIKLQGKQQYYQNLLSQLFETEDLSFVNAFYKQSLIKKRIVMLSQSRSKQFSLVKYALFLPIVFAMLLYTSSYAQDKTVKPKVENQELTDSQLEEKYYNEIVAYVKKGGNIYKTHINYLGNNDKYLLTREELFKQEAYMRYLLGDIKEKKIKEGTYDKEKDPTLRTPIYKTYNEYLAYKKTDEGKRAWDNQTKDGVLRLVVDNIGNITSQEQKLYDKKLKMIENDDYFNALLITDGKSTSKVVVHSVDGKKNPDPNNKTSEVEWEEVDTIEVPFSLIEDTPTFKSCANLETNEERKQCMSQGVAKHVNKNFNIDLAKSLGLVGKQRINVIFKIDKEGNVTGIKARAPHPDLEEEAKRVIAALPQFIPGKQKGKPVIVPYSLPIIFQINPEAIDQDNSRGIPFSKVDVKPVLMTCQHTADAKFRTSCTVDGISAHINKNFDVSIAKKLKLDTVQRIAVLFKINKSGYVSEVKVRAMHPELEEEAKRVVYSLPKFVPGQHQGEVVDVKYSLPIKFKIAP